MTKWFDEEINPVLLVLHKYEKLNKWTIIRSVSDCFEAVGEDEFNKALDDGLIKTSENDSRLYELTETAEKMIINVSEKWMNGIKEKYRGSGIFE